MGFVAAENRPFSSGSKTRVFERCQIVVDCAVLVYHQGFPSALRSIYLEQSFEAIWIWLDR